MSSVHRQWYFQDDDGQYRWHGYPPEARGMNAGTYGEGKPLESHSMCVHPNQVKEANERMKTLGLSGCYYKPNGILEFTSRGTRGRKGFCKAMSFHDNDAGYSDAG